MSLSEFRLIAPPPTPFHADGSLNLDAVQFQADLLLQSGVDGVFLAGSTGESSSLSVDERVALAQRWIDVAHSTDLEVLVQAGHNCQADAMLLAGHAQSIGADGVSAHAPNYFKPASVEQLIDFLEPIARAAGDLPFYYYDIPGMTNVSLDMQQFLSEGKQRIANLAGLKYSHLDLMQLQRCADLNDGEFELLFGCDQALLAGVVLGVDGAIGSTYNYAAPWYRQMIELLQAGDLDGARARQAKAAQWIETMAQVEFLAACKALLEWLGVPCGPVRAPLSNLTTEQRDSLYKQLEAQGLFQALDVDPIFEQVAPTS